MMRHAQRFDAICTSTVYHARCDIVSEHIFSQMTTVLGKRLEKFTAKAPACTFGCCVCRILRFFGPQWQPAIFVETSYGWSVA